MQEGLGGMMTESQCVIQNHAQGEHLCFSSDCVT